MIFNIIVALCSGFMTGHNLNTMKEDYYTPYTDCKVWGAEDGTWPSKVRWGAKLGLDGVSAVSSGLVFADSISGGRVRTKAIREILGGFETSEELKDKYSKVSEKILGKKEITINEKQYVKSKTEKDTQIVAFGDNKSDPGVSSPNERISKKMLVEKEPVAKESEERGDITSVSENSVLVLESIKENNIESDLEKSSSVGNETKESCNSENTPNDQLLSENSSNNHSESNNSLPDVTTSAA